MQYKVELYSRHYQLLSGVVFDDKREAALHIMRIITDSKVLITVAVEKIYSTINDKKVLTLRIYRLYEQE